MAEIVDYIDRWRLLEELRELGLDLNDAGADAKATMGLTIAMRHVRRFPAADVKPVPRWIPVTPETMPELKGVNGNVKVSDDLLLRVSETTSEGEEIITVYAGYYQEDIWVTFMKNNFRVLDERELKVTHWMYADKLKEVYGDG